MVLASNLLLKVMWRHPCHLALTLWLVCFFTRVQICQVAKDSTNHWHMIKNTNDTAENDPKQIRNPYKALWLWIKRLKIQEMLLSLLSRPSQASHRYTPNITT